MLSRSHRFHGYGSLKGTYSRGSTVRSPLITIKYLNRSPDKPYRVAIVVSKKVAKSAVVRNRIRRRLYAATREQSALIAPGTDLVVTVFNAEVAVMPAEQLVTTVSGLLQKIAKPANNNGQTVPRAIVKPDISAKGER
ncbi:MAG: ribonuclease P protein component [Patescibacteria group bacterium]|nr:ribonuclease P protein component [Patescibacteria group bacterium]